MSYIGNTQQNQSFVPTIDYFSGNGSTTAFTLSRAPGSSYAIEVVVNNVQQNPSDAFTISGSTLTFSSAPSSGTNNIYVYYTSPNTQVVAPSAGTVQSSSIASGGPTWDTNGNLYTYNTANIACGNTFGFKNRIINGSMMIDQRNAGASVTPGAGGGYTLDRWCTYSTPGSKFSVQQNAGSVTPPSGFTKYIGITSTSAYSITSTDYNNVFQAIEGLNISDLGWGAVGAATVTLSFWVRSSLTGTFGGSIRNGSGTRSYPFTYTISSANTWEQKTVTIPGDTTGTWATDTGVGMNVYWGLGVGSTYSGTAGAWAAANYVSATGAVSVVGTNGATFYITGVQLEKGSVATPFDFRSYGTELALCQRYYEISNGDGSAGYYSAGGPANSYCEGRIVFITQKRAVPTVSIGYTTLGDGNVNWDSTGSANQTIASSVTGTTSVTRFNVYKTSGLAYTPYQIILRWSASAEL